MATILYAEDSPVMRRVVAGILRDKGHVVIEAASYDELKANAKANKGKIDLVISDVQLERGKKTAHGIVFYNSLRKTDEEQPIILLSSGPLTALASPRTIERMEKDNKFLFQEKMAPNFHDELLAAIQKFSSTSTSGRGPLLPNGVTRAAPVYALCQ
jgi:CheY-like chemotaxis protein